MQWFLSALKKYATFSGRARRAEYWYFILFYLLIFIGLGIIDRLTGTFNPDTGMGLLSGIFTLAALLPCLAVAARRLHDTGRSGWWLLLGFIPLIGSIVLIVFFVQNGAQETNAYGPDPKAIAIAA